MRSCNTGNGTSFRVTALAVDKMLKLTTLYYKDDLPLRAALYESFNGYSICEFPHVCFVLLKPYGFWCMFSLRTHYDVINVYKKGYKCSGINVKKSKI